MREGLSALCLAAALALLAFAFRAGTNDGDALNTVGGVLFAGAFIAALVGLLAIGRELVRGGDGANS